MLNKNTEQPWNVTEVIGLISYSVHVNAICVGPGMLKVLFQPLAKATWDLVKPDELFYSQHLGVVASCTCVQSLDDGRHIPKYAGVH